MEITQRPRPWTDEALAEARREALTAIYGSDPDMLDMVEKEYEIRALARDAGTCGRRKEELKRLVKDQRGADPRTRGQLEVIKELAKQIASRIRVLDGRAGVQFPGGQVLPANHAQTGRPAGGRLLDHITDAELDTMFPPLIPAPE